MRKLCFAVLIIFSGNVLAGMLPPEKRDELIPKVLERFWGHAKLANGQLAQPASEKERKTVPISHEAAYRAIDAGEISGLAEWCHLDWRPHYIALMTAARNKGLSDKQLAFISVLHGVAQGGVSKNMNAGRVCGDQDKKKIQQIMTESKATGMKGT